MGPDEYHGGFGAGTTRLWIRVSCRYHRRRYLRGISEKVAQKFVRGWMGQSEDALGPRHDLHGNSTARLLGGIFTQKKVCYCISTILLSSRSCRALHLDFRISLHGDISFCSTFDADG